MADFYRVTTGNWNAAGSWSSVSGSTDPGDLHAAPPSASDNVIFDELTPTGTHTVADSAYCNDITCDTSVDPGHGGFTIAFTNGKRLYVAGHFTADAKTDFTNTAGYIRFDGETTTAAPQDLTLNGGRFDPYLEINLANTCLRLAQDTTVSSTNFGLYSGAFRANSKELTINPVNLTSNWATVTFWYPFSGDNAFYKLNLDCSSIAYPTRLYFMRGNEITNGGTVKGAAANKPLYIMCDAGYTLANIPSTASTLKMGVNFTAENIAFIAVTAHVDSAADWDYSANTSVGLGVRCSGITVCAAINCYWVSGTGNSSDTTKWFTTSGGAVQSRFPLLHDTMVCDDNSFTGSGQTLTLDHRFFGHFNADAVTTNNPRINSSLVGVYCMGDFILPLSTQTHGAVGYYFGLFGEGSRTFDTNGSLFDATLEVDCRSGTYTLGDDLIMSFFHEGNYIQIRSGTFDANDYDIKVSRLTTTGSLVSALYMGSGTWNVGTRDHANTASDVWTDINANMTVHCETSTIKVSGDAIHKNVRFLGGGKTFYNFEVDLDLASTKYLYIANSNTFTGDFKVNAGRPIGFYAGSTTTVASFTAGSGIQIFTETAGTHTLTKTGGGVVKVYGATITNSTATPASTWYAIDSTDGGGNTGWIFETSGNAVFFGCNS